MIATRSIEKEIQAQKRIIRDLKRDIFGIDKTFKSRYIKQFRLEFSGYERVATIDEVLERARACNILYFGDYHPLRESQDLLLLLMRELASGGRDVVLALEMLYTQQQVFLDQWMKGKISEEEFLESIEYTSEWGFSWESYSRIFELAKDPFIPIFGIDSEPRDHLKYIRMRDSMIAQRICTIRKFFPEHLVLVAIGESHLASGHLPSEVGKRCGEEPASMTIVQNIDEIYWRLLEKGKDDVGAVKVDKGRYCIFTTSPVNKYQAYKDTIDTWIDGEEGKDNSLAFENIVNNILYFLLGDKENLLVTSNGGLKGPIVDAYPEIQCRKTYKSFSSYLRSLKIDNRGLMAGLESLRSFGVEYMPSSNSFLVLKYSFAGMAREAARFVVHAMRDDIGRDRRIVRNKQDAFYAFVMEEALAYFGSKIVDPRQDCCEEDPILRLIDSRGVVRGPLGRFSMQETRDIIRHLKYHFMRERNSSGVVKETRKLREIYDLRIQKRLYIVKTLGCTLGGAMYHAYHSGDISHGEILDLFRERFLTPGSAKSLYLEWVERISPFRGGWAREG